MGFLEPRPPPYDVRAWHHAPFVERLRQTCVSWAQQGNGAPGAVYVFYLLKIAVLYVGVWLASCSLSSSLGPLSALPTWALSEDAFARAVVWTMAYEGLGLGCASGPLTGRYSPPIGGVLYFLRPGTTKLSFFPRLPLLGGTRRTRLDVGLYVLHYALLGRALVAPELTPELLLPTLVLLPVLGLADKTIFLASRAEHHYASLVCLALATDWIAGCKIVWLAIWLGAATSKLNRHFPAVVCVMLSNAPLVPGWLKKRLYRRFPDDLRPSRLATLAAHGGTITEYTFPLLLLASDGGITTAIGLGVMFSFHTFITSNMPLGVPIEWNVIMVYGAFFLFGVHADASVAGILASPGVAVYLAAMLLIVPVVGNLEPRLVSFLLSMRYYAGNWAYSVWLFRGDASKKLDRLTKSAPRVTEQLERLLDDEDARTHALSSIPAFRLMHLHGRALHDLLPRAVDDVDAYEWIDGELVAGLALGWNFGDGHLHGLALLGALQAQCGFEPGELRCIMVESQPILRPTLAWTIADATSGVVARGEVDVRDLVERQPWPAHVSEATFHASAGMR